MNNIPCTLIPRNETQYQHISSTLVREGSSEKYAEYMPANVAHIYHHPYTSGLSEMKIGNWIIDNEFVRELITQDDATDYAGRVKLWNEYVPQDIIKSPRFIKQNGRRVHISLFKNYKTMMDYILEDHEDLDLLMELFVKKLRQIHNCGHPLQILHGDMNPTNVIVFKNICEPKVQCALEHSVSVKRLMKSRPLVGTSTYSFGIVDFDKVKTISSDQLDLHLREWYQLFGSIRFFTVRHGIDFPNQRIAEWIKTLSKYYFLQKDFTYEEHKKWVNEWKMNDIVSNEVILNLLG